MPDRLRVALILGLAVVAAGILFLLPPISQDLRYHEFAGHRTVWGVPNFWNVVSNLGFLLVALWGLRALRSPAAFLESWERAAYCILLAGLALVAAGSTYYHLRPDNGTLFWDRLPMTVVFMSLLAATIGERISAHAGRLLLLPLVALGVASVVYWRFSGDLRLYGLVQYYPLAALPLMVVLFPPRYSGAAGLVAMMGFYALAKLAEGFDRQLAAILPAGGHPWKHVAAAAAMLCYVNMVARRRPVRL
ncbi:MAG: ceramidase domain-containing protein [Bryobacteraceae bacterium]